jgi:hypothetical protein
MTWNTQEETLINKYNQYTKPMETKTSKVTKVTQNTRNYASKFGTMYVHVIEFENGDKGDYSSQKQICEKFTEGNEASYTIETKVNGQYTNVIVKPAQSFVPNQKKFGSSGSEESFALSYAKDLGCARIEKGIQAVSADTVIADAEKFYSWLKSKKENAKPNDGLPF